MSVQALPIAIFRYTASTDDYFTVPKSPNPFTDVIIFNDPNNADFKDTKREGAYITSIKRVEPEGIGNNQAAEKDDGNVQPLGIVEGTWEITGFISNVRGNASDGVNSFVSLLRTWKDGAQVIVNDWEAGRFGIEDENDQDNTLAPIGSGATAVGLIFQEYSKTTDYNRNRVDFVLIFRRSRGLDV